MRLLIVAVLALDGLMAQAGARPFILAANKTLTAAVAKADIQAIMSVYSTSPEMVPPDSPAVSGREAVANVWKEFFDHGMTAIELVTTDVDTHGATADEQGTFTSKHKDGSIDKGQYHSVWTREKGAWKLQRIAWQ